MRVKSGQALRLSGGRMTGGLSFANDVPILMEEADATERNVAIVSNTDIMLFGDTASPVRVQHAGDLTEIGPSGAFHIDSFRTVFRAVKTAAEIRSNDASLGNDDDLVCGVEANTDYLVEGIISYVTDNAADFRIALPQPSGATLTVQLGIYQTLLNSQQVTHNWNGASRSIPGPPNNAYIWIRGILEVGATAGNLQFQWCQDVATGFNTTLRKGSLLYVMRIP